MTIAGKHVFREVWSSAFAILCVMGVTANASLAEVDNAALLYYQALIECPKYDTFSQAQRENVLDGKGSFEGLREIVESHRDVIRFVEIASQITHCNWGIQLYRQNFSDLFDLRMRSLVLIVGADAQLLAISGDSREALKRCLMLRSLALRMGNDPNLGFNAIWCESEALSRYMRRILGLTRIELQDILWLRHQLALEPSTLRYRWMMNALKTPFNRSIYRISINKGFLQTIRNDISDDRTPTYKAKKKAWNGLSDDELLTLIQDRYTEYLNAADRVLAGIKPPYKQTLEEFDDLTDVFLDEAENNPLIITTLVPASKFFLRNCIRLEARTNALEAAIAIYLIKAQTGQLPKALPENLPKNPYNDEDFQYELTEEGFTLHFTLDEKNDVKSPYYMNQFEYKIKADLPG